MTRLAGALAAMLLAACALRAPSPEAFAFAVLGDTPYSAREEEPYQAMLRRLDREPLAFVVHVGDFKRGATPCTDEIYQARFSQFDASRHPFIYTPGDNEWIDCRRNRTHNDPLERLAHIRRIFFATPESLGRRRIATEVQSEAAPGCSAYPENRAWERGGVRFVTLNVSGSDNGTGFSAASDAEARCRNEANRRWLERAVAAAESPRVRALVVAFQANPWFTAKPVFADFVAQLRQSAQRLRKPMLLVHGDSHTYRVDTPVNDPAGQPIANLTRVETYGSPFVGWVRITVDPGAPGVFTFEPKLQAIAP